MFAEDTTMRPEVCSNVALPIGEGLLGQANGLHSMIGVMIDQVEAQLVQSDIYRRALESLQQLTAEGGIDGQLLLKAVSLEAIRLTLDTIAQQVETSVTKVIAADPEELLSMPEDTEAVADKALFEAMEAALQSPHSNADSDSKSAKNPIAQLLNRYRQQRQVAKIEEVILTRAEILVQLGERVKLERESRDMSIAQLHARTFIPMYHLQALEGGHTEQLPEDIYLRGFLRRIENALTLPTGSLVEALPSEAEASIVPSWYESSSKAKRKNFAGLEVNPTHLYFTYAAIMAGGVCWLSQQTAPKSNLPVLDYEPRAQSPMPQAPKMFSQAQEKSQEKSQQKSAAQSKPQLISKGMNREQAKSAAKTASGMKIGVAPPETLR